MKEVDSVQYYAAKKINKEYMKIIQLDAEFEKLTKIWRCTVGESFWSDEKTVYLTETNLGDRVEQYFKVNLIEK